MGENEKLINTLKKLQRLLGSANANEAEAARAKIHELLAKHKKTWNDFCDLMEGKGVSDWRDEDEDQPSADGELTPAPLDLIHRLTEKHHHLTDAQRIALTLWIVHTFIYTKFSITPRLALLSPVKGCGKSTVLDIIELLGFNTYKTDNITAAALFRTIDRERPCFLLDEADNQDLPTTAALRAVMNSGHRCGGNVMRYEGGNPVRFQTFAPLALAAIGRLPLPILDRSIVLHMERAPRAKLERFDPKTIPGQANVCKAVYRETLEWAQRSKFNTDPPIPDGMLNRVADNWRMLLAIADACSEEWGKAARNAAIELSRDREEDMPVLLLGDIRDIFDRLDVDRISSAGLIQELIDLPHGRWIEWRGPKDSALPRQLTQAALAGMLAPFGIKPRTIWPRRRRASDRSSRGYLHEQFTKAWASYCDEGDTPTHPSNIKHLRDK
jgi:hypothetical protein